MVDNLWSLIIDPVVLCLIFFVLWILTIQNKQKVQYQLNGRLANQHTINNFLMNSISIVDSEQQMKYLLFVSKFVNYGYVNQDKQTVSIKEEIEQIHLMIQAHEISSSSIVNFSLNIDESNLLLPVIPFSIITIVENALKYGELDNRGNQLKIDVISNQELFHVVFSGYKLPEKSQVSKPIQGHGLHILKGRLKFYHFDKNSNNVTKNDFIHVDSDNQKLVMTLPK